MIPSARAKFLLIAPELARLAREAQEMAGYSPSSRISHHALSPAAELRETKKSYFSVSHHQELLKSICWRKHIVVQFGHKGNHARQGKKLSLRTK